MPELPEVETVRRGLEKSLVGATIAGVRTFRPDLRFPFPASLQGLAGQSFLAVDRRAKYLLFRLSGGTTILSHLGMTGTYRFVDGLPDGIEDYVAVADRPRHDHLAIALDSPDRVRTHMVYADPRRFGFVDAFDRDEDNRFLRNLGPEPLSNAFDAETLAARVEGKGSSIKVALLDQTVVAGLGNIYVCEALHRVHLLPTVAAGSLVASDGSPKPVLEFLVRAIRDILGEAIREGGSTLKDYRQSDGSKGAFQERFAVYGREGKPCPSAGCGGVVARIVQGGRSTFFCPDCQVPV